MKPSEILRELQTLPKKQFGQNFLVDEKALSDIVAAGDIQPTDTVVEIGPGLGALTEKLIHVAGKVIAIEADRDLAEYMRNRHLPKTTIVTGDALQIDWTIDIDGDYKIVANIPYSITSPLMRKIFQLQHKPERVILLVQKEVAERLTAKPGQSNRGYLTLIAEANCDIKINRTVHPGSFYPSPKVDSAVITITPKDSQAEELLWPAIEAGFSHKRQTLVNGLTGGLHQPKKDMEQAVNEAGLPALIRPAELTLEQWKTLSKILVKGLKTE